METIEISYIDTVDLNHYIRESLKRWVDGDKWETVQIVATHVWREQLSTKAVYCCLFNQDSLYPGPFLMIYVNYDEVGMSGIVEFEFHGLRSNRPRYNLMGIFAEVFATFDPSTAPLPFGVKCQHCGATYVYEKRTGTVNCQNCGKSFDLEYENSSDEH